MYYLGLKQNLLGVPVCTYLTMRVSYRYLLFHRQISYNTHQELGPHQSKDPDFVAGSGTQGSSTHNGSRLSREMSVLNTMEFHIK